MKIHVTIPFSREKDLGKAYNEACSMIGDDDWICLLDHDVMFLTPDAINIMYGYVERYPDAGMLTCFTNRIHPSSPQLYQGISDQTDIIHHINVAGMLRISNRDYETTPLHSNISGFLMLISKKTWMEIRFVEGVGCLGVDTKFWQALIQKGKKILRMNGLYVFHQYRLQQGISNKDHLK
jgi:GT2 family glycosyltransferase